MDYNNNNYDNENYNNNSYSTYAGDNDAKTYDGGEGSNPYDNGGYSQSSYNPYDNDRGNQDSSNPYEQSYASTAQNYNQAASNQSHYISSEYSSSYGQNTYQTSYNTTDTSGREEPVSLLDWVGTLLLAWIPCVAIIVYLIWAFDSGTKKSKSNYCKAYLLVGLISTVLVIVFYVLMFVFMYASTDF